MLSYRTINLDTDKELVVANRRDSFLVSFGDLSGMGSDEEYVDWLKMRLGKFPEGALLAFDGVQCVGHIEFVLREAGKVGHVNLYYVLPEYRGQGYGRELHQYMENVFRQKGARRMELRVSPTNRRAVGFYERMGFQVLYEEHTTLHPVWRMGKML